MNRSMAVALLLVGIVLLGFGANAYHSAASGLSRLFTGAPTDKAIWLIAGGALAAAAGALGLSRS